MVPSVEMSAVHAERPPVRALPQFVTFRDLIRSNQRKSTFLVVLMIGLGVALGAAFAGALAAYEGADAQALLPSVALGAAAAGVAGVLGALWSYYGGAAAILAISGAKPLEKPEDPQLYNVVEELAIAAGMPTPKVYLIQDDALNAFATGRDPAHAAVAITTGLRSALTRDELAGVMAHELSHVRHLDIRLAMLMATMVGLIVFACDAFWRIMWQGNWGGTKSRSARGGEKGAGLIIVVFMVAALLLAAIAPTLAMLIRMAISRQREYLADAGAVELTRYPQGLIGALQKLGDSKVPLKAANRATAHLYIVNPLKQALRESGHEISSVFLTHPPLGERIARLQALVD